MLILQKAGSHYCGLSGQRSSQLWQQSRCYELCNDTDVHVFKLGWSNRVRFRLSHLIWFLG
ncbi:hypothetical protein LINPERHAP1_LOCUS27511 [Linum perenne]